MTGTSPTLPKLQKHPTQQTQTYLGSNWELDPNLIIGEHVPLGYSDVQGLVVPDIRFVKALKRGCDHSNARPVVFR